MGFSFLCSLSLVVIGIRAQQKSGADHGRCTEKLAPRVLCVHGFDPFLHFVVFTLPSNSNPLDLIERDRITRAVLELGGARAFMRRHRLGIFQRAAGFQVGRDPGGPERMAVDPRLEAGISRADQC